MDQAPSSYSPEQVQALLARDESVGMSQTIAHHQLFVARLTGEVMGLGGWRNQNVYNLYVHPAYMRRGIGSALMEAIEAQFMAKTFHANLFVDAGLYTRAFYVGQGYEVLREVVSSDGLAYLEMQKRLR